MSVISGAPATIECDELKLEGMLHLPEGRTPFAGLVICHPHPQHGGDMYNGVVGALVQASMKAGVAALRFNFRGVGGSEGQYAGGAGEVDDVGAAVEHLKSLREIDQDRVALAGYSFGAVMALRFAGGHPDLAAVIAVSQPVVAGTPIETYVEPPLLVVAGDRDEYCDIDVLTEQHSELGEGAELEILPGVDHFWWGSFDRLEGIVSSFLTRKLTMTGGE